jgi:hypothetical protein
VRALSLRNRPHSACVLSFEPEWKGGGDALLGSLGGTAAGRPARHRRGAAGERAMRDGCRRQIARDRIGCLRRPEHQPIQCRQLRSRARARPGMTAT